MNKVRPTLLRVLCVDDNELIGEALRERVSHEPDLEWAGAVSDGSTVMDRVRESRPDVVLMDIDMPGTDTFALVEQLAADMPQIKTVMLSGHVPLAYINRALDAGAWGYLSKNDDTATLMDGIRRAARGEIVLSKEVEAVRRRADS